MRNTCNGHVILLFLPIFPLYSVSIMASLHCIAQHRFASCNLTTSPVHRIASHKMRNNQMLTQIVVSFILPNILHKHPTILLQAIASFCQRWMFGTEKRTVQLKSEQVEANMWMELWGDALFYWNLFVLHEIVIARAWRKKRYAKAKEHRNWYTARISGSFLQTGKQQMSCISFHLIEWTTHTHKTQYQFH